MADATAECYETYHRYYKKNGLELGEVIWYKNSRINIANCITQKDFGTDKVQADYPAIRTCVKKVLSFTKLNRIDSVGFPKIGAGLAGGDWKIISEILKEESANTNVKINVYILDPQEYQKTMEEYN